MHSHVTNTCTCMMYACMYVCPLYVLCMGIHSHYCKPDIHVCHVFSQRVPGEGRGLKAQLEFLENKAGAQERTGNRRVRPVYLFWITIVAAVCEEFRDAKTDHKTWIFT
jgi:hypothetical protein